MSSVLAGLSGVVVSWITSLGYWGIAAGMALESCNIPLPSEVILPFAGYLVFLGRITFWEAVLAGTLGGTAGSLVSYYLGRWGGRPLLERYGRYIGINAVKMAAADRYFERWGEATVFFTRLLPVIRTFISLPAGIAEMNVGRFVVYTFLGSLPWSILLVYLGVKLGENWTRLGAVFHRLDVVVVVAALVLLAWWLLRRKSDG
ncbi:MAG TPA: DedA family protein [Spirochaetia bacterium]|nr:DedA family protein [Spirochaetia bacterium]